MRTDGSIYGLIDPRSGELRYVGKTSASPWNRADRHVREARAGHRTHRHNWLRQLLVVGLRPDVEVLEVHGTPEALAEAERHFIAYFRSVGCNLTNLTDGGEGTAGLVRSAENKAKVSAARKGRPNGRLGKHHPDETKAKMRASKMWKARPFQSQHGVIYQTQQDASKTLSLPQGSISRVLRGERNSVRGYTFQYLE